MQSRRIPALLLALGLAAGALAFLLSGTRHRRPTSVPTLDSRKADVSVVSSRGDTNGASGLKRIIGAFQQAPSSDAARRLGPELKSFLDSLPRDKAVSELQQLLDAKLDFPTGLGFVVGRDGFLKEAPSMRALLLDELGRRDSQAAAAYAAQILAAPTNPEEWALALRNYALGRPDAAGHTLLLEKTRQLLRLDSWQHNPSAAYLEAFDVAVHLGGNDLVPDLTNLIRQKDNRAVSHAAFLALDRIVIRDPVAALTQLQTDADSLEGREATRANYFARANVGDAAQRAALENYLLDPRRSESELASFAGVYPNANYMISANLLTPVTTPDRNTLTQRDAVALSVLETWLADPRFDKLKPHLLEIQRRLGEFVRQAASK
jgi:hypothetical protein